MKLTVKQKAFCDYYIELGNATEAYIKAGYKAATRGVAEVEGFKLLRNPKLKEHIDARLKELESDRIADASEVLMYLTSVMRGEYTDELVSHWDGVESRAEQRVSMRDRNKAAELLGKRYRLFVDKVEQEIDTEIVVKMEGDLDDWSK